MKEKNAKWIITIDFKVCEFKSKTFANFAKKKTQWQNTLQCTKYGNTSSWKSIAHYARNRILSNKPETNRFCSLPICIRLHK
jgi:hypothetical protein